MGKRKKAGKNKNSFKIKGLLQLEKNVAPTDGIVGLSNNYGDIVKNAEKSGNKQDLAGDNFGTFSDTAVGETNKVYATVLTEGAQGNQVPQVVLSLFG